MTRNQRPYSLDGFSSGRGSCNCRSNQDDGEGSDEEMPAVMGVMSMG